MADLNRTQQSAIRRAVVAQEKLNAATAKSDDLARKRNAAVREAIREHKVSQKRLAAEIGVSRSMVYKILSPANAREAS
jgi:ribosome-binding protein aMBF1 (putative translation factor)